MLPAQLYARLRRNGQHRRQSARQRILAFRAHSRMERVRPLAHALLRIRRASLRVRPGQAANLQRMHASLRMHTTQTLLLRFAQPVSRAPQDELHRGIRAKPPRRARLVQRGWLSCTQQVVHDCVRVGLRAARSQFLLPRRGALRELELFAQGLRGLLDLCARQRHQGQLHGQPAPRAGATSSRHCLHMLAPKLPQNMHSTYAGLPVWA